jgi:hypothetical protein
LDQAPPSREAEDVQRLLRELDVEPPRGAAERVWRRGVGPAAPARRRALPRWAPALGALATAALAVALWPRGVEAPEGAHVIAVRGEVHEATRAERVAVGQRLAPGATVRASDGGHVRLSLGGTALSLEGPAELRIDAEELTLSAGRLEIAPAARALAIVAAPWRAELEAGGSAELTRDARGGLSVEARASGVRVLGPEPAQALGAGQRWSSPGRPLEAATTEAVRPATIEERTRAASDSSAGRPAGEVVAGVSDEPARRGGSARAPEGRGSVGVERADVEGRVGREASRTRPDPVAAKREVARPEAAGSTTHAEAARAAAVAERPAPGAAPLPPTPSPSAVPTPAIPERWDEDLAYRRARAERDPDVALRLFDVLIAHEGALAPAASLQAAELQLRRGVYKDAHRRYTALLAQAPRGPLAPEAHLGAVEALVRLGRLDAAREALEAAVVADRALAASPELAFLKAELARRAGRCEDAVPDYRRAQAGRSADDAAYNLAWCLLTLDEDEGRGALRAYLEQHPRGRHADKARARLHSATKE